MNSRQTEGEQSWPSAATERMAQILGCRFVYRPKWQLAHPQPE